MSSVPKNDKTKLPLLPEPDYVAIANKAQEVTGRSVWPSTVKAILEAARAVREAVPGWQPIETAPTDVDPATKCGPPVLVAEGSHVDLAFYHDGSHCYGHRGEAGWFASDDWGQDRLLTASNLHPTHWMPLPSAPTQDQENGS